MQDLPLFSPSYVSQYFRLIEETGILTSGYGFLSIYLSVVSMTVSFSVCLSDVLSVCFDAFSSLYAEEQVADEGVGDK